MTAPSRSLFSRTKGMTPRARGLRQELSDAERKLWGILRRGGFKGLHIRRQHPVGPYTLDFYCAAISLAIEVDGGQHAEPDEQCRDVRRTRWLASKGIRVVRFWNNDVLSNLQGVWLELDRITDELTTSMLTPSRRASRIDLPLSGGGGASGDVSENSGTSPVALSGNGDHARPSARTIVRRVRSRAPLPLKGGGLGRGSTESPVTADNLQNSDAAS